MTQEQFKKLLFTSIVRENKRTEVRVGITLRSVMIIDSHSEEVIKAAEEAGRNEIMWAVYGEFKEKIRGLLNDLIGFSQPAVNGEQEYYEARKGLIELMKE